MCLEMKFTLEFVTASLIIYLVNGDLLILLR